MWPSQPAALALMAAASLDSIVPLLCPALPCPALPCVALPLPWSCMQAKVAEARLQAGQELESERRQLESSRRELEARSRALSEREQRLGKVSGMALAVAELGLQVAKARGNERERGALM